MPQKGVAVEDFSDELPGGWNRVAAGDIVSPPGRRFKGWQPQRPAQKGSRPAVSLGELHADAVVAASQLHAVADDAGDHRMGRQVVELCPKARAGIEAFS